MAGGRKQKTKKEERGNDPYSGSGGENLLLFLCILSRLIAEVLASFFLYFHSRPQLKNN